MEHHPPSDRWAIRLAIVAILLGWGWSWVGVRSAVQFIPPLQLALGRYLVASLTLLPIWWLRGRQLPLRHEWLGLALTGLTGFTLYNFAINAGERVIPAGTASMVVACIPVLTTLGAVLCFGERLTRLGWLGVVVAFLGVGLIHRGTATGSAELHGLLLLFGGACSATAYNLLSKRYLARYRALDVTTWSIWAGTVGMLPAAGGFPAAMQAAPTGAIVTMIGLGVIPAAMCYSLWAFLMSRRPLARMANLLFLVPVVAILLGWLIQGELPHHDALFGGSVVVAGVTLVMRRGKASNAV